MLPKPYWNEWNKASLDDDDKGRQRNLPRTVYTYPSLPLPAVPEDEIQEEAFAVQAGRGADYAHLSRKPVYIDTMDAPYAVFSFKYRSKAVLENTLKMKIADSELESIQEKIEKEKYMGMPKDVLVDQLLRSQQRRDHGARKNFDEIKGEQKDAPG